MTEVTSLSLTERESLATLMGAIKGIDWGTFPNSECNVPPPTYTIEDLIKTFGFYRVQFWWDEEDGFVAKDGHLSIYATGLTAYDAVARLVIKVKE